MSLDPRTIDVERALEAGECAAGDRYRILCRVLEVRELVAVGLMDRSDIDPGFDQGVSGAFDILDFKDQFDQRLARFLTFACRMQHQDQAPIGAAQFDDAIIV